jgi:hypothetical protein
VRLLQNALDGVTQKPGFAVAGDGNNDVGPLRQQNFVGNSTLTRTHSDARLGQSISNLEEPLSQAPAFHFSHRRRTVAHALTMMPKVTVIVQSCPERRQSREGTLASLRASDVGENFTVMEHPDKLPKCLFFASVLDTMAKAPTPYVMRIEDDVLVNRHILHNFLTWRALHDPLFGAGWLYVSEAAYRDVWHIGTSRLERYRTNEVMYGSLCVAMPRALVASCIKLLVEWQTIFGCALDTCNCSLRNKRPRTTKNFGQDAALSRGVWSLGKRVFFPKPVLAENRLLPSTHGLRTSGHAANWKAGKLFNEKWKRTSAQ